MSHSAPVVALAMTGAEPFTSVGTGLSIGGGPGVSRPAGTRTAPDGHESAISSFRGRNVAKPARQDLQLPKRRSQIAIPWGNSVAPLQRRTARNVVEGSKREVQLPGYQ